MDEDDLPAWATEKMTSVSVSCDAKSDSHVPEFILEPRSFDVILLVDNMEVTGGRSNKSKEMLVRELMQRGVRLSYYFVILKASFSIQYFFIKF